MEHRKRGLRLIVALSGIVLILAGCSTVYYRKAGAIGGGYRDEKLGPGTYMVYFVAAGGSSDNAMYGVTYRASEIALEHDYRYFHFTKTDDYSQDQHVHDSGTNFDAVNGVIKTQIKLYHDVPVKGKMYFQSYYKYNGDKYFDAYSILDNKYVPGTTVVYTRAMRRADIKKGIHTWEERQEQAQDQSQ
jgi:hypothetical protein